MSRRLVSKFISFRFVSLGLMPVAPSFVFFHLLLVISRNLALPGMGDTQILIGPAGA